MSVGGKLTCWNVEISLQKRQVEDMESSVIENYCTIRVKWNGGEADDEQVVQPCSFQDVVASLKQVRDRHANEYADHLANDPESRLLLEGDVLGGIGVEVTNRWGSVVEVGPGRDVWFLCRFKPSPTRCFSDCPLIEGMRVFNLDGGHYTELDAKMLVSEEECLRALRNWLDTGTFPEN